MTGKELLTKLKQQVDESGWLEETELDFASIYLEDNPASIPLGLLLEDEDGLIQIRRKFFYPLMVIGEALAEDAEKWGNLPQKPVFQAIIDPDYEWQTMAYLIWNNEVIMSISERASYFWFYSEADMADFLAEKYQEGVAELHALLSVH